MSTGEILVVGEGGWSRASGEVGMNVQNEVFTVRREGTVSITG